MGQSPSCHPAPETVPQDKRQCDAKACLTLYTANGLGGPCVHVIVTDTQPSVLSLMRRNLWKSENTTKSISKVQLLLWETLVFFQIQQLNTTCLLRIPFSTTVFECMSMGLSSDAVGHKMSYHHSILAAEISLLTPVEPG